MISSEQRAEMGVTEQMVRLSVGIEAVEDLIDDLDRALRVIGAQSAASVNSGFQASSKS
jgi:cystathionine gamma-lyase